MNTVRIARTCPRKQQRRRRDPRRGRREEESGTELRGELWVKGGRGVMMYRCCGFTKDFNEGLKKRPLLCSLKQVMRECASLGASCGRQTSNQVWGVVRGAVHASGWREHVLERWRRVSKRNEEVHPEMVYAARFRQVSAIIMIRTVTWTEIRPSSVEVSGGRRERQCGRWCSSPTRRIRTARAQQRTVSGPNERSQIIDPCDQVWGLRQSHAKVNRIRSMASTMFKPPA